MKLIPLLTLIVTAEAAIAKKTLCTITINSKEERGIFQKNLPLSEWDHVELLPHAQKPNSAPKEDSDDIPNWLSEACDSNIQCDVLLISGHFGGGFFGESNYELTLEQLERAACRPGCGGIVKKPKEVFLMGCNTLAGKEPDTRTPQEYLQVLLNDGMERSRAEQTVALRYSPWGDQNFDRMRAVFSNTAKIYGFNALGPMGNTAYPRLIKYFKQAPKPYSSYIERLTKTSPQNAALRSSMGDTTLIETAGEPSKASSAVCYLEDPKVPPISKLRFVERSIRGSEALKFAPAIAEWLKSVKSFDEWNNEALEMWDRMTLNNSTSRNFISLTEGISGLPSIQLKLWRMILQLHWIKASEFVAKRQALIEPFFADGKIAKEERQALCALADDGDQKSSIDLNRFGFRKVDYETAMALACLGNGSQDIAAALEQALFSNDRQTRLEAAAELSSLVERRLFSDFDSDLLHKAIEQEEDHTIKALENLLLAQSGGFNERDWRELSASLTSSSGPTDQQMISLISARPMPHDVLMAMADRVFSMKTEVDAAPGTALYRIWTVYASVVGTADTAMIVESLIKNEDKPAFAALLYSLFHLEQIGLEKREALLAGYLKSGKNADARLNANLARFELAIERRKADLVKRRRAIIQ
jgi:hypothetical protein